jgi:[protein-PII] uridylyltransferase
VTLETNRAERQRALEDFSLAGRALVEAITELGANALRTVAVDLPTGWGLGATGGLVRRDVCPGSDLDVVLLHPKGVSDDRVAEAGNALWYPLWDAGYRVTPLSHTLDSALKLARNDLVVATSFLSLRHIAGEVAPIEELSARATRDWQKNAVSWLKQLASATMARHEQFGEVAFLLEPDLKEGRGGLRDTHAIGWAVASAHDVVQSALETPLADLDLSVDVLVAARAELHRRTKRQADRLLLQEQDEVASRLGYASADMLMAAVSDAARTIAWSSDRFWWRVERDLTTRLSKRLSKPIPVAPDVALQFGALVLTDDARVEDPSLILRSAATAAQLQTVLGRSLLQRLSADAIGPSGVWPNEARRSLLSLLGAGEHALVVIEALDRYGLLARVLPEWSAVRSKPQRNAYHRFTVDWHLCHAVVEATAFVRDVARPDLLLLGAWLHDIGKGFPGDHTEVGEVIIEQIATRMGFPVEDVSVLVRLCRYHLLLAETATRRDLSDPGTIRMVADAVGDVDFLHLLRALTEADSRATGSSAWSDWKARLILELVDRTASLLAGHRPPDIVGFPYVRHLSLMDRVRTTRSIVIEVVDGDELGELVRCSVAAPDRPGLLAALAGVFSLHGVEIVTADAWTSDDGIAVDDLRVVRRVGGETNWTRVENDLKAALDGSLDLDTKLQQKAKSYANVRKREAAAPARAELLIDNEVSETATVVEVRAPDSIGLLWRVADVIGEVGLDIRHAKVATLGHEVVDVFYVQQLSEDGRTRVSDASLLSELERRLDSALVELR